MEVEQEVKATLLPSREGDIRSLLFYSPPTSASTSEPPLLLAGLADGQLLVVHVSPTFDIEVKHSLQVRHFMASSRPSQYSPIVSLMASASQSVCRWGGACHAWCPSPRSPACWSTPATPTGFSPSPTQPWLPPSNPSTPPSPAAPPSPSAHSSPTRQPPTKPTRPAQGPSSPGSTPSRSSASARWRIVSLGGSPVGPCTRPRGSCSTYPACRPSSSSPRYSSYT
jgi:hypothetical protein